MRDKLLNNSVKTSSALKACLKIATLLNRENANEWIDLELNGYFYKFKTAGEMKNALPRYRKARCLYLDQSGAAVRIPSEMDFVASYPLGQPVGELEGGIYYGLSVPASSESTC